MLLDFGKTRQSFRLDFRAGASGDVVNDDRNADFRCDFFIMLIDAFLGRPIVVGRNHQSAVGAGFFRFAREPNRFIGGVGAGAGDHRHAFVDRFDDRADDLVMFLMTEGRRLASGAARHDSVRAVLKMKVDQPFEDSANRLGRF